MFQLHDKTRRRICLAAFGLFCLTPTALVAGWCIAWQLPGHLRAETQRLQQQLGLTVALGGLRHLRPGVVVYKGLSLSDPETGQTVLRCPAIEVACTRQADEKGQSHPAMLLTVSGGEIEAAALGRLEQLVECLLQSQAGWGDLDVRLAAGAVTLRSGDNSQTLADVQAAIEAVPGGAQARAVFHLTGSAAPAAMKIRLIRNRQLKPPAYGLELDTGGVPLPCGLLAAGLAELKPLGPASRFCGHLWATQTPGGWTTERQGKLSEAGPPPQEADPLVPRAVLRFGRVIQR
jgi:hypothetical protein